MTEFKNINIVKKANIYFDGKVTSRTILFGDGSSKTLGVMLPGEYEFNTDKKELMEIQSGLVEVLLPDESDWKEYKSGEEFYVKAKSSFKIKVLEIADYCCSFIEE
jgi:hypothetical protein